MLTDHGIPMTKNMSNKMMKVEAKVKVDPLIVEVNQKIMILEKVRMVKVVIVVTKRTPNQIQDLNPQTQDLIEFELMLIDIN